MTTENAKKKLYGLVGWPVKHSFSAAMHNAAFAALKINAEYRLFEVAPEGLCDFIGRLSDENIEGINVTIPHKESAIKYVKVDKDSFGVKEIKAINTIRVDGPGDLKGFNTDWAGFGKHLEELGVKAEGARVALIGAGGAARAVCYLLLMERVALITVYDVDIRRSDALAIDFNKRFGARRIETADSLENLNIAGNDILINASPMGMKAQDAELVKEGGLRKGMFVYDLVYNPPETKLLSLAKKNGVRCSSGLGMLLHQGALAFKIWTGLDAPIEVMRSALEKEIAKI